MVEQTEGARTRAENRFSELLRAGERAQGQFHCTECGYGVTVYRRLPPCPMCSGASWEQTAAIGRTESPLND